MSLTYDVLKDDVRAGRPIDFGFVTYVPERTAAVEVSHGSHGPEPRFPGDAWTMHHVCSACGGAVDGGDVYCRHCGARLADNEKE